MTKPAGKPCPDCGEPMSDLRSMYVRQCTRDKWLKNVQVVNMSKVLIWPAAEVVS